MQLFNWNLFLLLLGAVKAHGHVLRLELFLRSRVPSSVLWFWHSTSTVPFVTDGKLMVAQSIADFLRHHPTGSQNCAAFQIPYQELVVVEGLTIAVLQKFLQKLSYCVRRAQWKPVVVLQLLHSGNSEHLGKDPTLNELVSSAKIPMDGNFFLVTTPGNGSDIPFEKQHCSNVAQPLEFWEIYTIKRMAFIRQLNLNITEVPQGLEILTFFRGVAWRRKDFHGAVINGATQNDASYRLESRLKVVNGTLRFGGGVAVRMFQDLEFALNFKARPVQGKGWLAMDETGQWVGVGKQVIEGEADVCVSLLANTDIRGYADSRLQLLIPTLRGNLKAFFIQPDASELRDIFKHPVGTQVWIVTGFLLIFTFVLIKLSNLMRKYARVEGGEGETELESNSALVLIAIVCQQGWFINPNSPSMKILSFSISVAAFILYVSFSAAIVSTLALEVVPIRDFAALVASRLNIIGDQVVPKVATILEEVYHTPAKQLRKRGILFDIDTFNPYERILDGSTAHLGLADEFVSLFRRMNGTDIEYCSRLSWIPVKGEVHSSMFLARGSPFKEAFNFGILKTMERGLNACRSRRYNRKADIKCEHKNTRYRNDLGIADVRSAYFILIGGHCLSLAFLVAETLIDRVQLNRRQVMPE